MQEPNYRKLSNVKKHQGYDYARSLTKAELLLLKLIHLLAREVLLLKKVRNRRN